MGLSTSGRMIAALAVCMIMVLPVGIALSSSEESDAAYPRTYTYNIDGGSNISTSERLPYASSGSAKITESANIPSFVSVSVNNHGYIFLNGTAPREGGNYTFTASVRYSGSVSTENADVTFILNISPAQNTVTYRYGSPDVTMTYTYGNITLYDPAVATQGYVLNWYDSEIGGSMIGRAGGTAFITDDITLYGRLEQTNVILPNETAHAYVHYRDTFSYVVDAIPSTATITAQWVATNVHVPISISGNVIWVDYVDLDSGIYEMAITASAPSLTSTQMLLIVHVYPHEVRNLEPYGLSPWSYIVPTYNDLDSMELIGATRTFEGETTPVLPSTITLDRYTRMIAHTFTEEGLYEFTLRLISPAGDHITTIIRINVTDDIISAMPHCDGMTVIVGSDGMSVDAVLINPGNYASITWDYGDGNIVMNSFTSAHHTYDSPRLYTITAHLSNSLGQTVTVSSNVNIIEVMMPEWAYRNTEYIAIVIVAATSASDVTVDSQDWLDWEYVSADGTSYVIISGMFTDVGIVGDMFTITVGSNGVQDAEWLVRCDAALSDTVDSDFDYEVTDLVVRVKYTGTRDGATRIFVQWIAGLGYQAYTPTSDGWMYYEYDKGGSYVLTVSAIRGTIESTASRVVIVTAPDVPPGPGPDPEEPGSGTDTASDIPWNLVAVVIVAIIAVILAVAGKYGIAGLLAAVDVALVILLGVI